MSFETFLRLIQERDLVLASVVNRPLSQLDANVRYLWEILQAASIGSTLYAHSQTVDPAVQKGMAVWYNPATQRFERCLALTTADPDGRVRAADMAHVWGIVAHKLHADLADILLYGWDDIDISGAVSGPVQAGTYYLSGTTLGHLTRMRPALAIAVLRAVPGGKVFVCPQFIDTVEQHTHHRFELVCAPAGDHTPPLFGARHVITNPNPALSGWLPASHPVFAGKAPPLAVFGYNLAAHPELESRWPPQPLDGVSLEWDKGTNPDIGATQVPLGPSGLCIVDRNGIWWTSNCYGDVPWPVDYVAADRSESLSLSLSECLRDLQMRLTLWFTRVQFASETSAVLSLQSRDSRIKVLCCGTNTPANTGHLDLALDLNLSVSDQQEGHLAFKEFDPQTQTFRRGGVVEGVYALGPNVQLTSAHSHSRTIQNQLRTVHQGLIGISVVPEASTILDVQLVRLDGAEEEYFLDYMYIGFVPNEQREYRAKIYVPDNTSLSSPKLRLRFLLLGRVAGTLPQLEFTGRLLPRALTATALPGVSSEFTITCVTTKVLTANNQYVEAESDPINVQAGDTLFFTVRRLATDGYTGELGVLKQIGVLTAV